MTRPGRFLVMLASAACQDAAAPVAVANSIRTVSSAQVTGVAGTTLTAAPTFVVTDANGNPAPGVPVTIVVTEGGGSLTGVPSHTAAGPTSVGRWTLGTKVGRNAIQVQVATLDPLTIAAIATAGPAAAMTVVSGGSVRARAGAEAAERLMLLVTDQHGNPIEGANVSLALDTPGAATLTPTALTTDDAGRTPAATWKLGLFARTASARASLTSNPSVGIALHAEFDTDYDIDVRFSGTPDADVQRAFRRAADRIAGIVVGDLPVVPLVNFDASRCGGPATALTEQVDDVVIYASVTAIDGPGKILGRAGPCFVRNTTRHTVVGSMQFDEADAQSLISSGRFEAVVLHEMLHVIGIGSLWRSRGLLEGEGTGDPRFTGTRGTAECVVLGFSSACGSGSVPVENSGGSGTAGAHWRESVFDSELMTGFAESSANMPFSRITAGALDDFGYVVYLGATDPFALATPGRLALTAPGREDHEMDEVLSPLGEINALGWVRRYR